MRARSATACCARLLRCLFARSASASYTSCGMSRIRKEGMHTETHPLRAHSKPGTRQGAALPSWFDHPIADGYDHPHRTRRVDIGLEGGLESGRAPPCSV